jgi:hypothetical protein
MALSATRPRADVVVALALIDFSFRYELARLHRLEDVPDAIRS